ncbi:TPA: hypothetical protein ACGB01_000005 [Serratia marcescens]
MKYRITVALTLGAPYFIARHRNVFPHRSLPYAYPKRPKQQAARKAASLNTRISAIAVFLHPVILLPLKIL